MHDLLNPLGHEENEEAEEEKEWNKVNKLKV
jgi:hypothetical protein